MELCRQIWDLWISLDGIEGGKREFARTAGGENCPEQHLVADQREIGYGFVRMTRGFKRRNPGENNGVDSYS